MRVVIVGKIEGKLATAAKIVMSRGAKVSAVHSIREAINILLEGSFDLILIDIEMDVEKMLLSLKEARILVPLVACGLVGDTSKAVLAIKAGAKEFLPLPPDEEMIAAILEAACEDEHKLRWFDPLMSNIVKLAEQVASSSASIFITGSSGTGKELLARYIHNSSARKKKRFVAVNCAAIPEALLESELFGYEKGAFTGANARKVGKFEEANHGTILLDEISEMDPKLQAKLLRVLQESEIDRLGGSRPIKVDTRVIATSNLNIEEEVQKNNFRQDLFFRLNVINIVIPDLVERSKDIMGLAKIFVDKYCKQNQLAGKKLSPMAEKKLLDYSWPGNVRELENVIHRAVLVTKDPIIDENSIILSTKVKNSLTDNSSVSIQAQITASAMGNKTLADIEREIIIDTVNKCLGNRTHASNILGISIRTIRNKLKKYEKSGHKIG